MNKERRKKLKEVNDYIEKAKIILEAIKEEEEDSYENMTEGLQATARGEQMENNISEMEDAIEGIMGVLENLELVD